MTKLTQKMQYEYQATSDSFLQHDRMIDHLLDEQL